MSTSPEQRLARLRAYAEAWDYALIQTQDARFLFEHIAALTARLDAAEAERDRLRARTHELQEAHDRRTAPMHARLAELERYWGYARDWWREHPVDGFAQQSINDHARVAVLLHERDRLRGALREIRDTHGQVCEGFTECSHESCRASYSAWHVADVGLAQPPEAARGDGR